MAYINERSGIHLTDPCPWRSNMKLHPYTLPVLGIALSLFFITSCAGNGSTTLPRKTIQLLDEHGWNFAGMKASDLEALESTRIHDRYYLLEEAPEDVWASYLGSDPARQWTGPIARFAALYDPDADILFTPGQLPIPGLEVGQILFLDLTIEFIVHFPTAFMITRIDEDSRIFVFKYLEGNPAQGMQEVSLYRLSDDAGAKTLIRHRSWFENNTGIRDRLYPSYHEQAIDEFHANVAKANGMNIKVTNAKKLQKKGLVPGGLPL